MFSKGGAAGHGGKRLLKFGKAFGRAVEELLTMVSPATFYRWVRQAKDGTTAKNPKGVCPATNRRFKVAEFDLEDPEFFDFKAATAWVTKLDACAKRGGKPVPTRKAAPPAPEADVAKTISNDDEDDERTLSAELGF